MNFGQIDYSAGAPTSYFCKKCKVTGCKLWREYQTCADYTDLLCADCAVKNQKKKYIVDNEGYHIEHGMQCDQIGWLVPAVPTEEGDTFWGYTSVPQAGVDWWRRLPTRLGKRLDKLDLLLSE